MKSWDLQKVVRINQIICFVILAIIACGMFYEIGRYFIFPHRPQFFIHDFIGDVARTSLLVSLFPLATINKSLEPHLNLLFMTVSILALAPAIAIVCVSNIVYALKLLLRADKTTHRSATHNLLFAIISPSLIILLILLALP